MFAEKEANTSPLYSIRRCTSAEFQSIYAKQFFTQTMALYPIRRLLIFDSPKLHWSQNSAKKAVHPRRPNAKLQIKKSSKMVVTTKKQF